MHRLGPGDVAIIDHADIDRVSAEELLESGVRVVVNVAASQTGRYPNPGPLLLVRGGVRLIDAPGAPLFDELDEGELVTVRGASVFRNGTCLATGRALEASASSRRRSPSSGRASTEALRGLRREHDARTCARKGGCSPRASTSRRSDTRFRDRHALVVARGPGHKRDLRIVRRTCATSSRC